MRLFWTPEAEADRDAIYDYIEPENPRAAVAPDEQFERKAAQLVTDPMIGRADGSRTPASWSCGPATC